MAAPAWATLLTTFWLEGATTVTAIGTGGAGLGNPETDFFIQGSNCISKGAWTNATKGLVIDGVAGNFTVPTDGAVIFYAKYDAAGSLDTKANGGFQAIIGSTASAYYHFYIGGSNTLAFDSWFPYTIDPNTATVDATTGSPGTNERWVGILANLPTTSGPTKGNPIAIGAIRYGRCTMQYTAGDISLGYNTFNGGELYANDPLRRWGLLQLRNGSYLMQGFHSFGTAGTAVDFRDSNKIVFIRASGNNNLSNNSVSNAFNRIELLNASSNFQLDNVIFQALGTRARGRFYHTAGTWNHTNCQYVDTSLFSLLSTTIMTDCTFRRTSIITAPGSTLNGSKILTSRAGANLSALVWNVATDPSGKLNNMTFSKGTNAHHAIEFGTSSPTTMTLVGAISTGFNAANAQNDSFFHIKRTTGSVTINLSGGTGNFSYRTDGATVSVVTSYILTLTGIPTGVQVTIVNSSTRTELQNSTSTGANITYAHSGGETVDILFMANAYDPNSSDIFDFTLATGNESIPIKMSGDRNYSNPTEYDVDAQSYIDAVGTLTGTQKGAIDALVISLKSGGVWSKLNAIWPILGGTASSHKWNLKNPLDTDAAYRITFTGTWTHDANGAKGDGSTAWGNTHFIDTVWTDNGNTINGMLAYYSNSNVAGSGGGNTELGSDVGPDNQTMRLQVADGSGVWGVLYAPSCSGGTNVNNHFGVINSEGSTVTHYSNGSVKASATTSTQTTATHAGKKLGLNATMDTDTTVIAGSYSTRRCAFAAVGEGMTAANISSMNTAVQTYQTTLGRQN